jgi:signal transduction histidine kinase
MLRNKEFMCLVITLAGLTLLAAGAGLFVSPAACAVSGGFALFISASAILITRRRYRSIALLNTYLKRINSGDYALDVRDNTEGELSILKNEIYKVTVMLRERSEQLQKDKTALQNALSDISHQLKTPITSMFVMTDLLLEPDLPEDKRLAFTDRIRAQLERLSWLVSSLLKLSRLDAKAVVFKRAGVPASRLLNKALAPLRIPAELKNITLDIHDNGACIICDENWTAEAVLNIVKNCVEHTPKDGAIRIICTENPLFAQLRIEDTGPGIREDDLPHIFTRFYRGKNAANDSVGIGLAMAATIVQEQSGSIEAGPSSSGGSVFTLRFPK